MSASGRPLLSTRQLEVGYAGTAVAAIPDLEMHGGLVWHVTGPNGSGKTTLLKTLAGLLRPVSGRVERPTGMGPGGAIYVHAVPYVFAGAVRRNLELAGRRSPELTAVADAFGLSALLDQDAATLSFGQQRRLALARALAGRPAVLLVDEPEDGLDDEALAAWRACAARAVEAGEPALVIAALHPLPFRGLPVRQVRLSRAGTRESR